MKLVVIKVWFRNQQTDFPKIGWKRRTIRSVRLETKYFKNGIGITWMWEQANIYKFKNFLDFD